MFRRVDRKSILKIGRVAAGTIRGQYKSLGVGSQNLRKSNLYPRVRTPCDT